MARKRKQRSSEAAVSENPDPQPEQEEQSQPEPIQEEEAHQNPQTTAAEDNSQNEEQQQQEQQEEEEQEQQRQESKEEEEVEEEQQQNDDVPSVNAEVEAEANGVEEEIAAGVQEDYLDDEPLENLLEPFGKDQLVALLRKAVDKHPDLMDSVREFADADPAHRKIFVHGLGWDATAEILRSEFGKYGDIEDCKVVMDRVSGKSKGYAFILYKRRIGARKALEQPQKKIGNRITSCQLATIGPVPAPPPTATAPSASEYTQRKIFVSNVSAEIDPDKLLQFFRQYGEIEEGPLGIDKHSGKPKGFALFVYKSIESAKKALEEPHKNFEGHVLNCQKAIDGPKPGKQGYGYGTPSSGGGAHHYQQSHHHQPHYQQHVSKKGRYTSSGASGPGHLMAPSASSGSFNQGMAPQGLNPALGQALTALIATQGTGLGINNLFGALGGAQMGQGGPPAGYGNQAAGGYGNQPVMQGGYVNPQMNTQMGQGGAGRSQQGGAPYSGY